MRAGKLLAAAVGLSAFFALAANASAATIQVTDPGDPGTPTTCTLRQAIASANADSNGGISTCTAGSGPDQITFAPAAVAPLTLTAGVLQPSTDMTITGPGMNSLTITAAPANAVFRVTGGTVSISGLSTTGGSGNPTSASQVRGGCIYQTSSSTSLTVTDIHVFNCSETINGTGTAPVYADGGGIGSESTLTVNNSIIENNHVTTTNSGAGGNEAQSRGGGIYSEGDTLTVHNSTIANNTATATDTLGPDAFASGGINAFVNNLNIDHSTINGNAASASEGATFQARSVGGIHSSAPTSTMELGTVAGNTADTGGTTMNVQGTGGVSADGTTFTIRSSTIAGNGATTGSQEGANLLSNGGDVPISNTIIANPRGGGHNCVVNGTITSGGFNDDFSPVGASCFTPPMATDMTADPQLLPLGSYGGPTQTMALLPTSPVIDKGSNAGDTDLTHDQRGLTRPVDFSGLGPAVGGNNTDIGAYEVQLSCASQALPTDTCPIGGGTPPPVATTGPTGQRAAALKRCKKKHGKRRKKCVKHANRLPV